jgi:hypothetical protein
MESNIIHVCKDGSFFLLSKLTTPASENYHGREWANKKLVEGHDDFSRVHREKSPFCYGFTGNHYV